MNGSALLILLVVFGSAALVAVVTVALMRYSVRLSGHEQVFKNGIVMTDSGIEYLGFLYTGTRKAAYSEIDSVELSPYYKVAISALFFRYGISATKIPPYFFGKILVIRLKHPNPIEYHFFTPRDAAGFFEQLTSRIKHEARVA
jgi:hypothetical protein